MFELSQLRCFVAVAEELHFGRAAAKLNMTQPPLSRQIQILERILDVALLERTSRSVRLTPAGRGFLANARRIVKLSTNAARQTQQAAAGKMGTLKIGFTAAAAYTYLPRLISVYRQQFPDVDLSMTETGSARQVESLRSGDIDVGLMRPPVARPEFDGFCVAEERLVAALPLGHPLAKERVLDFADFDQVPFIMYAPTDCVYFHDLLVDRFAHAKVAPDYVFYLGRIHSMLSFVRAGLGATIVPEDAAVLHADGVIFRPLRAEAGRQGQLYVTWPREHGNPILAGFLEVARSLGTHDEGYPRRRARTPISAREPALSAASRS